MKKSFLFILIAFLFVQCEVEQLITDTVNTPEDKLTEAEAGSGLKAALSKGISEGAELLSKENGYFGNPKIMIPWPEDAQNIADKLNDLGFSDQVRKVELTINRGAEDAAQKAKPIFMDAINQMSFNDAMKILFGDKNSATNYLKEKTYNNLEAEFKPVIDASLQKVNATKYWGDAINTYNKIPFVQKKNPDLTGYVTDRALSGLFLMVAEEEEKIRENPIQRTSAILKKVFGYYDRHKN